MYLCITSSNNPVWYDDITVYRQPGAADLNPDDPEPTAKPEPTDKPEPTAKPEGITISEIKYREDGSPYLAITNNSGKDEDINIFAASYNAEGVLVRVSETSASVKSDGNTVEIGIDANAGDKVFIWDKEMRPLTEIMVAE